ncbi:LapA family protein [Pontibacterium granulatum]|uniref:LapA family protein n=1 Tax=Pontibacterium granulatum TaxID=2036029 RepID=UPI00249C93F0|nr:LapA family protein [Pontibacterium granulatum]MDI3322753.1 LapA family protein [Pontibacterium granulatum]
MRWIKGAILGLLCLLFLFVGVMFTINNTEMVAVDLVLVKLPEASLSLWLVATFILGGILGMAISVVSILLLRTRLRAERRRVSNAQKELDQLRTAGLKNAA